MAPITRIIHTIGGRYKNADAVEDAPLSEFISLRATGLQFNVVHPIPAIYLADLNDDDRSGVHAHITSNLDKGQYEGDRFVTAAKESLETLTKIMHGHDTIDSDGTSTTDTSTTTTSTRADINNAKRNIPGSFEVEELTINTNGMVLEPGGSQTPLRRTRRDSDTSKWLNDVPAGESPPSVKAPSTIGTYHTCNTRAPSPTRGPQRHRRFTEDPALYENRGQQVIERYTAKRELRDQEEQLDTIESLSASCSSPTLCRSLSLAIGAARLTVAEAQKEVDVSIRTMLNVRKKVAKALSIADDMAPRQADQAPLRNYSSSQESTQQTSRISIPEQSPVFEPQQPQEAHQQAQHPDPSSKQTEDALRDLDLDLNSLEIVLGSIKRAYLRDEVLESIDKARNCMYSVRLFDPREKLGYICGQFDPRLVKEIGKAVLEAALVKREEAESILYAIIAEDTKLDQQADALRIVEKREREREAEMENRRRQEENRAREEQDERQRAAEEDRKRQHENRAQAERAEDRYYPTRERHSREQNRRTSIHSRRPKRPSFMESVAVLLVPKERFEDKQHRKDKDSRRN